MSFRLKFWFARRRVSLAAWCWVLTAFVVGLVYAFGTFHHWSSPAEIHRYESAKSGFFFLVSISVWGILAELGLDRSSDKLVFWTQVVQTLHAATGLAAALAAAILRWRAPDNRAGLQVAGLAMAYALLGTSSVPWPPAWTVALKNLGFLDSFAGWLLALLTVYLPLGFARFLVIFPRVVDVESVHQAHLRRPLMFRWTGSHPVERSQLLPHWHALLVSGRIFWLVPAIPLLSFLSHAFLATSLGKVQADGLLMVGVLSVTGLYVFVGLPYAFASIAHLYRYGTDDERRRVAWLRAMVYGAGAVIAPIIVLLMLGLLKAALGLEGSLGHALGLRGLFSSLPFLYLLFVVLGFLPLVILALGVAVFRGGALDPRVAFTRLTLWSALGLLASLAFVLLERLATLQLVAWFQLSPDTGAVFAGAVVAATFMPARSLTSRFVERLAQRWIPLKTIAEGARVTKVVAITDLSGYTLLSAEDEPAALLQSAALRRQGERAAAGYDGTFIKSLGDAVIVTYSNPAEGLRAVVQLHREFPKVVDAVGLTALELHSALHFGELVESRDGDIFGQTVNVAARLVDAAPAGEIVVSESIKTLLGSTHVFEALGNLKFKNVPEPVPCYRWRGPDVVADHGPRQALDEHEEVRRPRGSARG